MDGFAFSFIILTNLEEFGLAKKAISLGAADYLIKLEITEIFDEIIDIINTYTPKKKQVINACINLYTFISSFYSRKENEIAEIFPFPDTLSLVKYLNHLDSATDMVTFFKDLESRICTFLDSKKNNRNVTKRI